MFHESVKVNSDLLKKCIAKAKNTKMAGLMKSLILKGVVESEVVCNSMINVDRGDFIDESYAYSDA